MTKLKFNKDYFKDEVRCGFFVPTAIKQAWAASLTVLGEIDRICTKYNIRYFADWGTMLGAVRHGGFVPWDDDLDICMLREDYDRFREVADRELPAEFAIHDFRRKENHWLFLSRVVNRNQICYEDEHLLKYHNFPYIASVDIFVKDYQYRDVDKERERCDEVMKLVTVADEIVENRIDESIKKHWLNEFENKYGIILDRRLDNISLGRELYGIAEMQLARTKAEESDNIEQIFPWGLKGAKGLPKEYYDDVIRLPFENTTIPVPAVYNTMLKNRYGNFLKVCKIWDGHQYPYFEAQRDNLQAVADFKLPEFEYDKSMLRENQLPMEDTSSFKHFTNEYLNAISQLTNELCENTLVDISQTANYLLECQQLAVDLANLIEQVKGEKSDAAINVVGALSAYCDALFGLYGLLEKGDYDAAHVQSACELIRKTLADTAQNVKAWIAERRVVLFLATAPERWNTFEGLYNYYASQNDVDIYVLALPLLAKDIYGNVIENNQDILKSSKEELYPEYVNISDWTKFDISLYRPDTIYIQDVYDAQNPCLTIPAQFYSDKLQKYTHKLICVQQFAMDDFNKQDHCDWHNMKYYVTMPGVIRADQILVQSEQIKEMYIEKLVEFVGEETRSLWENKISVDLITYGNSDKTGKYNCSTTSSGLKKKIAYCIGANELLEHKDIITDRIMERMKIFEDNNEKIDLCIVMYPSNTMLDLNVISELNQKILDALDEYSRKEWCDIINYNPNEWDMVAKKIVGECDAYYGSPSPLSNLFVCERKPVMISSYEVG